MPAESVGIEPQQLLVLILCCMLGTSSSQCTSSTCLNNGICDTNYTGSGFRCLCQNRVIEHGPRCELGVRSYTEVQQNNGPVKSVATHHSLPNIADTFTQDILDVYFEFSGACTFQNGDCQIFSILGRKSQDNPEIVSLFSVSIGERRYQQIFMLEPYIVIQGPAFTLNANPKGIMITEADSTTRHVLPYHWTMLHVRLQTIGNIIETSFNMCPSKMKACMYNAVRSNFTGKLATIFSSENVQSVAIGNFSGCIRFPRVNGQLVDLANPTSYSGAGAAQPAEYTSPFCPRTRTPANCLRDESSVVSKEFQRSYTYNFCGQDSECLPAMSASSDCFCRCKNAKRRVKETVTDPNKCVTSLTPERECKQETPILRTGARDYDVTWTNENNDPIKIGWYYHRFEFWIRTFETNAWGMLLLTIKEEMYFRIAMKDGFLQACIFRHECQPFPKVFVSDGSWHSVEVFVGNGYYTAQVDDQVNYQPRNLTSADPSIFSGETILRLKIPNSCVRAVRLHDIYMPTGGFDETVDDANKFIKVHMAGGVTAGASCGVKPTAAPGSMSSCTNCSKLEVCNESSGQCDCRLGYIRDKAGTCVAIVNLIEEASKAGRRSQQGVSGLLLVQTALVSIFVRKSITAIAMAANLS